MARPGLLLYFDVLPALDKLPRAAVGELLLAALHYAQDGVEPAFADSSLEFAWAFLRPSVDRDATVYETKRLKGEWLAYCKQCKRDDVQSLDFDTWRERVDNGTLHTVDVSLQTPTAPKPSTTPSPTPSPTTDNSDGADKPPTPVPQALEDYGFGPELTAAFVDWLKYKREKRQEYKPTGLTALVSQVRSNAAKHGDDAVAALIRQCMAANYQGIIWDKLDKPSGAAHGGRPGKHAAQDFQPSADRIQKNNDWLDAFLAGQEKPKDLGLKTTKL